MGERATLAHCFKVHVLKQTQTKNRMSFDFLEKNLSDAAKLLKNCANIIADSDPCIEHRFFLPDLGDQSEMMLKLFILFILFSYLLVDNRES